MRHRCMVQRSARRPYCNGIRAADACRVAMNRVRVNLPFGAKAVTRVWSRLGVQGARGGLEGAAMPARPL